MQYIVLFPLDGAVKRACSSRIASRGNNNKLQQNLEQIFLCQLPALPIAHVKCQLSFELHMLIFLDGGNVTLTSYTPN